MSVERPMEGLRVVELTTHIAGPTAARLLADRGADVIRVEPFSGDPWRYYGSITQCVATEQENPTFDLYNSAKRCIGLDLKSEQGKEIFFKLLESADVFITSNRQKVLKKQGIDYDSIKDRFPRLIYGLVTGYGQEGPDVDLPGYDGVALFCRSGLLVDMADPSGYPASAPGCMGDCATGTTLFGAICSALYAREKTGKGDFLEISLMSMGVWLTAALAVWAQDAYGYEYPKTRETIQPVYNAYKCADGEWIHLAILDYDGQFPKLCDALEVPELKTDERFSTREAKDKHRGELSRELDKAFARYTSADVIDRFKKQDIVFGKMNHFKDMAKDEQAIANDFMREFTFESGHKAMIPMPPVHSRNMGKNPFARGPLLGEHTNAVLKELGYSEEQIGAFAEAGAVKQHD